MSNEIEVYETQPLDIVRSPKESIAEARNAAKELQAVVSGKQKPVMFNGEQYLEFEDWQTVGNFYGLTSKVISTNYIEYGTVRGFEARSVALNRYGAEVSAAESMCLNDEPNWKNKPLFQLRSMAQTRACAKALRNILAWVVVLAGYKPAVAEEMTGQETTARAPMAPPQEKKDHAIKDPDAPASDAQIKAIGAMWGKLGLEDSLKYSYCTEAAGMEKVIESTKELTKGAASKVIDRLNRDIETKKAQEG